MDENPFKAPVEPPVADASDKPPPLGFGLRGIFLIWAFVLAAVSILAKLLLSTR